MAPIIVKVNKKNLIERGYKDFVDWSNNPNNLYIGRHNVYVGAPSSKWRNPYSIKKYGLEEALKLYENHIKTNLINDIQELLQYKELGCWCTHSNTYDNPVCHGQILLKLLSK